MTRTERSSARIGLIAAVLGLISALLTVATQAGAFGEARIPGLPELEFEQFGPGPGSGNEGPGPEGPGPEFGCSPALVSPSLSLSPAEGPSGTVLTVTGGGFCPDLPVRISFHTEQIAETRTDQDGSFAVDATVPDRFDGFAPETFNVRATGQAGSTRTTFQLTPP